MTVSKYVLQFSIFLSLFGCSTNKLDVRTINGHNYNTQETRNIGLLVPLSGNYAKIGSGILDSVFLASENYNKQSKVIIIDSELLKADISNVIAKIRDNNIKYVIGPVFREESESIANLLPSVTFFSFSNDANINKENLITCGLKPADEIKKLFDFSIKSGKRKILAFLPSNDYGQSIGNAIDAIELSNAYIRKIRYHKLTEDQVVEQMRDMECDAIFVVDADLLPDDIAERDVMVLLPYSLHNEKSAKANDAIMCRADQNGVNEFSMYFESHYAYRPSELNCIAYDVAKTLFNSAFGASDTYSNDLYGIYGHFLIDQDRGIVRDLKIYRNALSNSH